MMRKLLIRLSIVSLYFLVDLAYSLWKLDQIIINSLIEKLILFLAVCVSVYLITYQENKREKSYP